jgi:hypothetical protein
MRNGTIAHLVVLAASLMSAPAHAQASYDLGDAKHLKVLYAGVPDTPRAKAFV